MQQASRLSQDIVEDYGNHNDFHSSMATCGGSSDKKNARRDFERWTRSLGDDMPISSIKLSIQKQESLGTKEIDHSVLRPFDLVGSAYDRLPRESFEWIFFGPKGRDGIRQFWEKQSDEKWVKEHPGFCCADPPPVTSACPYYVHADWGQHINEDKILCVSWGGSLSKMITKLGLLLYTLLPYNLVIAKVTEPQIYQALVNDMHWLRLGIYPDDGNYKPGSKRAILAGRPFAGGLRFFFSEYRGDWEWSVGAFEWRGWLPVCIQKVSVPNCSTFVSSHPKCGDCDQDSNNLTSETQIITNKCSPPDVVAK